MDAPHASKITPFLWFNGNAEEAVDFYVSVFPNAERETGLTGQGGKPITIGFRLEGLSFTAMNYPTDHRFNKSVSFVVSCKSQAEIDHYWDKLSADGGQELDCGWVNDKFGLSWQIVPENIFQLVSTPGGMQAMLKMKKFIIADLEAGARAS